jgi:hypothetical protein
MGLPACRQPGFLAFIILYFINFHALISLADNDLRLFKKTLITPALSPRGKICLIRISTAYRKVDQF